MTTYKNRLPAFGALGYISPAHHKTGAGIETPQANKAHNRASGFFTCKASSHLFRIMVGRTGPLSGGPVSLFAGSLNPVRLTTPSLRPLGGELSQLTKQGSPSWPTANSSNASAELRSRASIHKPKSTADCTAPVISRSSCRSTCCTKRALRYCRPTSPPFSATWLTICANCNASPALVSNHPIRPGSSGAVVHPVNREVCP
ncbi:ash family protein [Salmonella enterica subsp. enterica serovar Anatum]|nr:ash family protein [Salmonella enterica subsp. enterica serovar Anatum]